MTALAVAINSTLQTVTQQHAATLERIGRAEQAGDYDEAARLRTIADSCKESAGRYRTELAALTSQLTMEV